MFINEVPNNAELSAIIVNELRDLYGIKFRKEKKLKSSQQSVHHKIFGVPLNNLELTDVKLSNGSLCRIPLFVSDACARIMDNIEVEGIFRKAGSTARQKEIREKLELGLPLDDSCNVIDVASILKYFFRELPEPLLPPGNFQETVLRCLLCKGTQERKVSAIKMVCLLLPIMALNTLIYFMQFLNLVSLHSTSNKMSAKNLAIIFAPGLMPLNESYGQRLVSHVQIIEILIDNAHEIGLIPPELLHRIPRLDFTENVNNNPLNFTMIPTTRRSMESARMKVPETDIKKKKKRRSGSLTRMFNGFRKQLLGAIGSSTENLDDSPDNETLSTPCINKSKKRKVAEASAFSSKKKKDVLALLPNGGILPSTPMASTKNKPTKKRLSLGGKRYSKNGSQHQTSNSTKSSIVSSLERRWSFMVSGSGSNRESQKSQLNTIQDTTVSSLKQDPVENGDAWEAQMTKSEYEEIKGRVTEIESRISKEFIKLQSSISNNSLDLVDTNDTRNGPERVLEKFERTLETTETMNASPMTEQLAKHLSRGLKIRSTAENRVIRSPSARKIGSIRRKSQEHVRLTRNKSWHLGPHLSSPLVSKSPRVTRKSPLQPTVTLISPNVEKHIQIPRANLKRGRPNTFLNGLRCTQQAIEATKSSENPMSTFIVTENSSSDNVNDDIKNDLKNEQWMCANAFFSGVQTSNINDENTQNSSKTSTRTSIAKVKPVRKRLNMNFDVTPTKQTNGLDTPRSTNNNATTVAESDTMKTPMLPPRLPIVKKTPAKTPHSISANRNVFTPLWQQEQQQIAGRASIARLRSQNAGMVMAKAKLFDGLVTEVTDAKKNGCTSKMESQQCTINIQNDQENKPLFEQSIRNRLNQSRAATNSPHSRRMRTATSGVHRRQQLRAQRHTPIKKTPISLDKSLVTINRISRNTPSPAMQSPITRRMASIDATPHAKTATMISKPPRRIITPQNKRKPV